MVRPKAVAPKPTPRPLRGLPSETRARIVRAAAELFNTAGYDGTDSNRIAREAGYSPGTFYKHFTDKRQVFLAVYEEWWAREWSEVADAAGSEGTAKERAERMVEIFLEHHRRWRGFRASLRALVSSDTEVRDFYRAQRRRQLELLERMRGASGNVGSREADVLLLFTLERTADGLRTASLKRSKSGRTCSAPSWSSSSSAAWTHENPRRRHTARRRRHVVARDADLQFDQPALPANRRRSASDKNSSRLQPQTKEISRPSSFSTPRGIARESSLRMSSDSVPNSSSTHRAPTAVETEDALGILIVDDDPLILLALSRMFRAHRVVTAPDVRSALVLIGSKPPFDVVISDLMMPERTGADFYREIVRDDPDLASRFVFVSGGGTTPSAREFLSSVRQPVVGKPFDRTELRRIVESIGRGRGNV